MWSPTLHSVKKLGKTNANVYQQTQETAMSHSLSLFIANLFMGKFETDLKFKVLAFSANLGSICRRHILCFWYEKMLNNWFSSPTKFQISFYQVYPRRINKRRRIPFLEMVVISNRNKLEIEVYRKPTTNDRFIPEDSNHSSKFIKSHWYEFKLRTFIY